MDRTAATGVEMTAQLFDGPTYDPALDEVRLKGQIQDVFEFMSDHMWWSVEAIATSTHHPAASVSAQIRHLRKAKHGAWEIDRLRYDGGLFRYRLTGRHAIPETKLSLNAQLRQQVKDLERELAKCHGQKVLL